MKILTLRHRRTLSLTAAVLSAIITSVSLFGCGSGGADTLIDERDGKKYKTAVIGGKRWMAENLNYQPQSGNFWCYKNDPSYCNKYGRLYDWETARSVCPSGWHLPSRQAWKDLATAAVGKRDSLKLPGISYNVPIGTSFFWRDAGVKLKARRGWEEERNGTDDYGFSALSGGYRDYNNGDFEKFNNIGEAGYWWTAAEKTDDEAYRVDTWIWDGNYSSKSDGLSVRCVKDEDPHTVTVSSIGGGAKGGGRFEPGDTVVITAGTAPGLQFRSWTSVSDNVYFDDTANSITAFTMPANDVTVTANFDTIAVESDTFTDIRDGKTYKTITIGGKTWMAQNLNYLPDTGKSWCYNDSASYCDKYGRLYDWKTALKACPSGWSLPSRWEWGILAKTAGGVGQYGKDGTAGKKLKAKSDENGKASKLWNGKTGKRWSGTDDYGFSALPGGIRYDGDGNFNHAGSMGFWWTASGNYHDVYYRSMQSDGDDMYEYYFYDNFGLSVRCLRDEMLIDDMDDDEDE